MYRLINARYFMCMKGRKSGFDRRFPKTGSRPFFWSCRIMFLRSPRFVTFKKMGHQKKSLGNTELEHRLKTLNAGFVQGESLLKGLFMAKDK